MSSRKRSVRGIDIGFEFGVVLPASPNDPGSRAPGYAWRRVVATAGHTLADRPHCPGVTEGAGIGEVGGSRTQFLGIRPPKTFLRDHAASGVNRSGA